MKNENREYFMAYMIIGAKTAMDMAYMAFNSGSNPVLCGGAVCMGILSLISFAMAARTKAKG